MRAFALAIAALLLLSACSDEPQPIEPDSTAAGKPAPVAPTMPDTAKEDTPSGAANFVAYWVSTFNYAAQTGDDGPMRKLARDCEPCIGYADDFQNLARSQRPTGPAWTLDDARVGPSRDPIEVVTEVRVLEEEKTYSLTFVLNSGAPFDLVDIYDREKS